MSSPDDNVSRQPSRALIALKKAGFGEGAQLDGLRAYPFAPIIREPVECPTTKEPPC